MNIIVLAVEQAVELTGHCIAAVRGLRTSEGIGPARLVPQIVVARRLSGAEARARVCVTSQKSPRKIRR